ncbi:MAG TPA: NAD-dependent succinate-semialdehyde dehydrogenase [Thermoplasmata archaeon]|nr:NAD-dependent succinate-semialdehyde dehydrogenase [Thermoplasmata archaeon]
MVLVSVNPATGAEIERFQEFDTNDVNRALDAAVDAFPRWRATRMEDRAGLMRAVATVLRRNKRAYAEIMAAEMGKPVRDGVGEIEKCAWACDFYADHAMTLLVDEEVPTEAKRSFVSIEPLGPVLAVMPWNFPFWQVFRFAAPALMAGNVGLLKHASNVPRCAVTIGEVFAEAGFPEGAFQTLLVGSGAVGSLVQDPRVRAITLTGSEKAGAAVAEVAGATIKKTVLELGGSDPFIVFRDADVDRAARVAAEARCVNSGQSCIAAKRFIVEGAVYDEFLETFREAMAARKVGDPMRDDTDIGPLAREDLLQDLDRQVRGTVAKGASVELGGARLPGPGFYYPPTILSEVTKGMPAYDEEVFGPVAAVIRAENEDEAIRIANDSRYGLGASLWTRDVDRGLRFAQRIEAGMVFINRQVKSDPRLPFGGVKGSGYGRELGSWGIREFVNAKTISVDA